VDVEDLRPGLVPTYRDPGKDKPVEITLLEPTIALAWKKDEAGHPRLSPQGGTVRWQGYLNVLRAGTYRFSARLRGRLSVRVGGKEVLAAAVKADAPALKQGAQVRLEAGPHPLTAEFTRLPGAARVELFWQAPHFHVEPLPHDAVFHLPARLPAGLHASTLQEHGRFLAEEHNCAACHQPDDKDRVARGLARRMGPDLSRVGERVYAAWLYQWLESPQKIRPGSPMPRMFSDDAAGRTERYAVARYLASLGGRVKADAPPKNEKQVKSWIKKGQQLFTSAGCISCHQPPANPKKAASPRAPLTGAATNFPLSGLGSKTTPRRLAVYLKNPLAVDPSGRMPNMMLKDDEARDLAYFLCDGRDPAIKGDEPPAPGKEEMLAAFRRVDNRAEELANFKQLTADKQWRDLGKRLVIAKGCNNCHTIAPGGKEFASVVADHGFDDLKKAASQKKGCLADDEGRRGNAPRFSLSAGDRDALRHFLREGTSGTGSSAPTYAARVTMERFNCLACHSRNGAGGLTADMVEQLRKYEKAENAEALLPPPLTGVGHKLRTPWLRDVLTHGGRARPWMALRMPQFGEANVGHLPEALAALEGAAPQDEVDQFLVTTARIQAGRLLVGKQAFGCITCHDIAGVPNSGTRGPDLALTNQRVRYEWFRRWLEQAQRMQPGTRMPTVFPDGKSVNDTVLGGRADAQAEAIWAYLSLGSSLPLPEGMEPPKGLVITVKDRPVLLRSFMPEAGNRAVAVGYPGGVATVFDAQRCRLAYGWSGNFLDASPVWDNRGGAPAKVLGPRFWTAPKGCPWGVNDSNEPPDFAAQAADPAYGADPDYGKVFKGRRAVVFEGYAVDKEGRPTFRYRVGANTRHPLTVRERPDPLRNVAGFGLARHFDLTLPAGQKSWLLAGEAGQPPRLLDARGEAVALDLKAGQADTPAVGRLLLLPQGGGKVVALVLTQAPEGTRWHLRHQGGTWQAMLGLPTVKEATKVKVDLNVWSPYRDEPEFIKEFLPRK
jgi:mono/diheme cytochrome c family protein